MGGFFLFFSNVAEVDDGLGGVLVGELVTLTVCCEIFLCGVLDVGVRIVAGRLSRDIGIGSGLVTTALVHALAGGH